MTKAKLPTNLVKHTNRNPLQQLLIKNFFSSLISLVKPLRIESILDAGCGEGFTMDKLSRQKLVKKIEGIEYSKEVVSLGKDMFPDLNIKQADIYDLPYKNGSFDLIICTEVLEHLDNPQKALEEMLRATKRYLILSVPNEPFFMLSNFLRGKNLSRWGNDMDHVNHWGRFSFKSFLKKNEIKIMQMKFPFPWIIVLAEKS